jgi:hypothetical protein
MRRKGWAPASSCDFRKAALLVLGGSTLGQAAHSCRARPSPSFDETTLRVLDALCQQAADLTHVDTQGVRRAKTFGPDGLDDDSSHVRGAKLRSARIAAAKLADQDQPEDDVDQGD